MIILPAAATHASAGGRRIARALMAGAAMATLAAGAASAQSMIPRAAPAAAAAVPAPDAPPPPVAGRDFEAAAPREVTGSVDEAADGADGVVPPAPAPTVTALAPVNAAIIALFAETGPTAELKLSKADREALVAFYDARQGAPLWIADGRLSGKAQAAIARISSAADDALNPKDFRLPSQPATDAPTDVARAEAELSAAALSYARKASGGRVPPRVVSPSITLEPIAFDAGAALALLDASSDVATTLDGFNPQNPQYRALRKLLAEARAQAGQLEEKPRIAAGRLVRPGEDDPRIPALRERLGLAGSPDDSFYDDALAAAVVNFQKDARIGASGLLNKTTIRALNAEAAARGRGDAELIEINMERWRWTPRDLGSKHVFVDIAAYRLMIRQDGEVAYETRVIVGKPTNQTPVFSNAIDHIVVNPYWNVPVSIALKEMRGGSLRGYEVVDSRGRKVDYVDWNAIASQKLRIRQPPGERNALGNIKFMFPNNHAVYLHDTPTRKLFERDARALSHGCVRVDKPLEFADALSGDQGVSGDRLKKMVGGAEKTVRLQTTIPVHLAYFTAWVGEDGRLDRRNDVYTLDARLKAALRGEPMPPLPEAPEPKIVRAKPKKAPTAQAAAAPPPPAPVQAASGSSWLSRLFGDSRN